MKKKFWNSCRKIRAFTLLECLVALLAISGSVLVLSGLTKLMHQQIVVVQDDNTKDWQIFCQQMRVELENAHFDKVQNNFLYVTTSKALRFGKTVTADDFRKSAADGTGYQPMIYGVKSTQITEKNGLVDIQLNLERGGKREFLYEFSNGE
ncbi:competence type IV pilus minor pilin ComGF [Lactococcus nasutitermitis]|uniref:Competence type IV pilus minor pilin ComGF n=2 Tax=Lactococcus nasutitermitis TaxID=1652957 RepID=A0ABV9JEH2_9LACT